MDDLRPDQILRHHFTCALFGLDRREVQETLADLAAGLDRRREEFAQRLLERTALQEALTRLQRQREALENSLREANAGPKAPPVRRGERHEGVADGEVRSSPENSSDSAKVQLGEAAVPARPAGQTSDEISLIIQDALAAAERVAAIHSEGAKMQEEWILDLTRMQCVSILQSAREDVQALTGWLEHLSAGTTALAELKTSVLGGAALLGEMAAVQRDIYEEIDKRLGRLLSRASLQVPPRRSKNPELHQAVR